MREGRPTSSTPEGSPIARRRRVEILGEMRAKHGGARESRLRRNMLYRQWRGFEQFAGAFETYLQQPALGADPSFCTEAPGQGALAAGGVVCELGDGQGAV